MCFVLHVGRRKLTVAAEFDGSVRFEMADHSELLAELPQVEKMATQDRLKHAKKRRMQQMKKWSQREKEHFRDTNAKKKKTDQNLHKKAKSNDYKVHFVPSVMLLEAAGRGDVDEVRRLLMLGVDPDSTNEDGLTALHQCCIDNNEDMMKLLVEFGANVNAEDSEKWTPLHAAATCGHINLAKYLVSKKANLLAVNADGNMPYDICENETLDYIESEMSKRGVTQDLIDNTRDATEKLMLDDLKWLAQQNAELEYPDAQKATPLHIAAANGYKSVVEFLLDQNVSTDVLDGDMWQPIHAAACWGHLEVLELLVQNGGNLDARTKNGETPFDICEDIDMKDRMMELKNEMESKRSTQTQRLRRSQSQNTRSQSVRRTSIRDKAVMTRQEAREEAQIRMAHQGKSQHDLEKSNRENKEKDFPTSVIHVEHVSVVPGDKKGDQKPKMLVTPYQKQPEVELRKVDDNKEKTESLVHSTNQEVAAVILKKQKDKSEKNGTSVVTVNNQTVIPSNSIPVHLSPTDVTLDLSIHLTVSTGIANNGNSNASTLAELKRQRMDQRKSQELLSPVADSEAKMNGHRLEPNYGFDSGYVPPSPSISMRKFTGMTSEEAAVSKKEHNCCIIL